MEQVKTMFSLTKHEIMFICIGIGIVVVIIKKLYPFAKQLIEAKKKFYDDIDKRYDNIDKKFDLIEAGLSKMEKGFNIIYEILLNNMIDEWKNKKKSHFADEKFRRIFNKYVEVGDGNSESILKQWELIPFE